MYGNVQDFLAYLALIYGRRNHNDRAQFCFLTALVWRCLESDPFFASGVLWLRDSTWT